MSLAVSRASTSPHTRLDQGEGLDPAASSHREEHYRLNRQRYIDGAQERKRAIAAGRAALLAAFFASHPCVDCRECDPLVLEFDHLRDKTFGISQGLRDRPWAVVLAEIEKCDVVCANCHRRRTARRGGFARAAVAQQ